MKNTAIGSNAGSVGSITASRRVPDAVPSYAAASTRAKLSTVGNALRLASEWISLGTVDEP